jgi:tRNA dimethylallyltransferase
MGPTAAGKTDLAVALVERFPLDIISVDSALVYQGFNIGAARPPASVLRRAPHRLVGFVDPTTPYSAADFRTDGLREIRAIHEQGRVPLLVGGTMLYFKVLVEGIAELPPADTAVRERLMREAEKKGWPAMHQRLQAVDPVSAEVIHPNNKQRIQRALEVYELAGRPMSVLLAEQSRPPFPYSLLPLALAPARREILHERIEQRFKAMLAQGLIDEVIALRQRPELGLHLPALRAVGYRQVWAFLQGKSSYEEMLAHGLAATRQLARRQMTWLRGWPDIRWLESLDPCLVNKASDWVSRFLFP